MDASSTADLPSQTLELPPWKNVANHIAALLVAILFIAAGVWKITNPFAVSRMLEQLLVPFQLSIPLTLTLAVLETFAGVMVLVPRFRRWGAWLATLLLLAFMVYIGYNYHSLIGRDCSCFPWVKRAVGPAFFPEDGAMLALAQLAAFWSPRRAEGFRSAAVVFGVVAVFTGVSYGSAVTHQTGTKAPDSITVDGKPYSLQHGRVFLFFYDPTCSHCEAAAKHMSTYKWQSDVVRIAIPVTLPQYAASFLHDTHFDAHMSNDFEIFKKIFPFGDPPYGVALENGRETGPVAHYDDTEPAAEPAATLRKLGLIE
jgi:uncharacterized membrane protein YphA (DoxX/SURF4 family)